MTQHNIHLCHTCTLLNIISNLEIKYTRDRAVHRLYAKQKKSHFIQGFWVSVELGAGNPILHRDRMLHIICICYRSCLFKERLENKCSQALSCKGCRPNHVSSKCAVPTKDLGLKVAIIGGGKVRGFTNYPGWSWTSSEVQGCLQFQIEEFQVLLPQCTA